MLLCYWGNGYMGRSNKEGMSICHAFDIDIFVGPKLSLKLKVFNKNKKKLVSNLYFF